ncbi:MAG: hypothetical protein KDK70_10770 [Myxococcales bacterium]|nr:hypothetical protein [Myxococcales bacterium]
MGTRYYTLVASLPALEHFETAKAVPINRVRLDQRLAMLTPEDAAELRRCERLIAWRLHRVQATAAGIEELYEDLRARSRYPAVLEYVEDRLRMRTVISALRARRFGTAVADLERPWGLGAFVPVIERRWDVPDFGLATAHPWVSHLRECIAREDARELGRAVFAREWRLLTRLAEAHPFGFPEVLSYVMRRDIVARWQVRDGAAAVRRFVTLAEEAFDERARLRFD